MSLLDDVSIVVTPNAYKAGELYAVIPTIAYGSELVVNGDFSNGTTGWSTGNSGVLSVVDGALVVTGDGGSYASAQQIVTGVVGKTYKLTGKVAVVSGSYNVRVEADQPSWLNLFTTSSTNFVNFEASFVCVNTSIDLRFTIYNPTVTSSDKIKIDDISLKEFTGADMDVTRATAATRVDENGLVNYAEVLGSEEVTNGDFATDSDWTKGTGWTISGGTANCTQNAAGYTYLHQAALTIGKTYKFCVNVISNTGGNLLLHNNWTGANYYNAGGATGKIYWFFIATTNQINLQFAGVGQSIVIDDVSVKEVNRDNVPRIDYTGGGCPHILAEPQRTNLITYSEDLTNSFYSRVGMQVVTESTIKSPDGTSYGYTIVPTSITQTHYLNYDYTQITVPTGIEVTYSIFVKPNGYNFMQIAASTGFGSKFQNFELTGDGVLGIGDVNNKTIEKIGDWYRISATETTINVNPRFLLITSPTALPSRNSSFAGNGTDGVLGWGVQVEAGSYATSYIPTSGSSVTRNQDLFTRDGIGSLINSTSGSFFIEMAALNQPPGSQISISLSGNNSSDRLLIYASGSGGKWLAQFRKNGVNIVSIERTTTLTNQSKVAVSWEAGRYVMYIDGNKATNYGSGGSETFPTTFDVGDLKNLQFTPNHNSTSNLFFGKVKQLQVYKTALTDEQLLQLTGESGTDFYESYAEMASALTYTIQ